MRPRTQILASNLSGKQGCDESDLARGDDLLVRNLLDGCRSELVASRVDEVINLADLGKQGLYVLLDRGLGKVARMTGNFVVWKVRLELLNGCIDAGLVGG